MQGEGRVVLVTGSSRGIGRETAAYLGERGYRVAVHYASSANPAEELVARLKEVGGDAEAFQADVADPEACTALVKAVAERFGALDALVNNAGITRDGLALRMKDDDWRQVIDTDLSAAFYLSRAALRYLLKSETGRIVNVSSVVALRGNAGQANYVAAKAGLIGLTKALAREYGGRGVTVNAVAPGFIESDMTDALPEELRRRYLQEIPAGRFGAPRDVAHAVAFLVSREAGYVNGQTLAVDGGMVMP
ncbi:MAG TPA: 3-oxoacyl-[acyl-carrier-protein] reductase [Trueperaceae bacterium]|nr:3-oxoacyl-[acyl-carrier-protein] reductase [Trueperaceae bacterium]